MLEIEAIDAGYGDSLVLRNVSLSVPDGAVVALLGPNGAGKTTLLRAASGLLAPSAGRVVLAGEDMTHARANRVARRGLCHIPEGRGVFPTLSVRENLVLNAPRGQHDEAIALAEETFPILRERMKLHAGKLSGGEQQMLALMRAYIRKPSVVLVDEPSMGLAPMIVDQIFEFLHRLVEEGSALLLVEQYVTRALEMADHAAILSRGEIVVAGTPEELRDADVFHTYLGATAE